ncbi:hypothetical protein Rhein_1338 [Rheinheimera sp. A13L]|uniref:hypothetical protein n=1 Tax=Rheinheimera sp. A13L TaxID=506534 RepID=UPI0002124D44|nr:hypothetical protein [Rheinheimera sp. A13L]EGM78562.1 hypothetical protein Rhein_1338 [Rheinheimera sp. A13L]
MPLNVGDWVRSYSTGIWQIYRVIEYKCRNPTTGLEQKKTTIFSKRFVSNAFRRSFKEECCDPALIVPLSLAEKNQMNLFIRQNENLYKKFQEYEPKKINCVYNARIEISETRDAASIAKELSGLGPMRDLDIDQRLSSLGYNTKAMPSWTVQFVSENFNLVNGYLVFNFSKVLEY